MEFHTGGLFLLLLCVLGVVFGNNGTASSSPSRSLSARSFGRVHIPWLGLGPTCTGCPQHYCDDDPAIIHGFCCGCARYQDDLPIRCPPLFHCPPNGYDLCEDYEYMMYCCCS